MPVWHLFRRSVRGREGAPPHRRGLTSQGFLAVRRARTTPPLAGQQGNAVDPSQFTDEGLGGAGNSLPGRLAYLLEF